MKTIPVNRADAKALVTFRDASEAFHVYVPSSGHPGAIAGVLLAVSPRLRREGFCPGETAADFIAAIDPRVRVRLKAGIVFGADYQYHVTYALSEGQKIAVRDGKGEQSLFDGALFAFTDWAVSFTGLESTVRKIVQFKYNGGSNVGGTRTVRVEKVLREGDQVVIEGHDLEKPDLKLAYRRYMSDKIEGDIVQLT